MNRVYNPNAEIGEADNITMQEHTSSTLQCNVTNDIPAATIEWLKLIPPVAIVPPPTTTPVYQNITSTPVTTTTAMLNATNVTATTAQTTVSTTTAYVMTTADWENTTIPANQVQVI